jgi:pimeloyl-ACP methyl ester carboxylesterase
METSRHRTAWIEIGPEDGQLMIFVHGWPELSLVWKRQMSHFATLGWRCVAPDMRGYGGSSVPQSTGAYAVRKLVGDMVELHDALGGAPAVWVGHDWGSAVVWAMASHHADRCRGVVNLCVPYLARGLALTNLVPLVDRELYPADRFPVGQWDYWLFSREHFQLARQDFEANVRDTCSFLYRAAAPELAAAPAGSASIRANGGWFGPGRLPPTLPRDESLMDEADFGKLVQAFLQTGFGGANAWYINDAANLAYAAEAPNFGRLALPVLFIHAMRDAVCDTYRGRLAGPMREDCEALTEASLDAGHEVMLERPDETNLTIENWLNRLQL